jgi:hypothetical protein
MNLKVWYIFNNVGGNEYGQCGEEPERKNDTGRPLRRDIVIPQRCASNLVVRQVIFFSINHYRVQELNYFKESISISSPAPPKLYEIWIWFQIASLVVMYKWILRNLLFVFNFIPFSLCGFYLLSEWYCRRGWLTVHAYFSRH